MPAYYTHYIYGIRGYQQIRETRLGSIIRGHRHAYAFGLAGPDFFLFSLADTIRNRRNIGSVMHEERTGLFLRNLYRAAREQRGGAEEIGLAYFAGFLGHYAMDCNCHPFVYEMSERGGKKESLGAHFSLEAAMDVYVGRLRRKEYTAPACDRAACPSPGERKVIAGILCKALAKTYPERKLSVRFIGHCICMYSRMLRRLADPSGKRERIVGRAEQAVLGYPFISPLFSNENTYGYTKKDWSVFYEKSGDGLKEMSELFQALDNVLVSGKHEKRLFGRIGNRSYHTGK